MKAPTAIPVFGLAAIAAGLLLCGFPGTARAQATTTAIFAQVAAGHDPNAGEYSTTFTLLNAGGSTLTGNLILTANDGNPLTAAISGPGGFQTTASSVPLDIPVGGTQFWTAAGLSPDTPLKTGWARVESTGGALAGVATFEVVTGNSLVAIAGVLPSNAAQYATIPIDNDDSAGRYTGYALANPGTDPVSIRMVLVRQDGTVVDPGPLATINLDAGKQLAKFFHEGVPSLLAFQGSVVMIEQNGKKFSVVALVQDQAFFTAIPVVPDKAPTIN